MAKKITDRNSLLKALYKLGFCEKNRIGRKNHPNKLYIPNKYPDKELCPDQPPFIIVPYKVDIPQIRYIIKELECWGFKL